MTFPRLSVAAATLIISGVFIASGRAATPGAFYVDPAHGSDANSGLSSQAAFLTIARAQQAVRTASKSGPVTVYLMPGTFSITSPLRFGPADSGAVWQAADPSHPAVVSGERDIASVGAVWSYDPLRRLWSLGGVTNLATRDLWVNGHSTSRVHSCVGTEPCGANNTFNQATLSLTANGSGSGLSPPNPTLPHYVESASGKVHTYQNPSSVEFLYRYDGAARQSGSPWAEPRCGVASVNGGAITMKPCFVTGRVENPSTNFQIDLPSEVENAAELFDSAAHGAQWYWNPATSTLNYQGEDGAAVGYRDGAERFLPPTSVIAGGLDGTLVSIDGATNLAFRGVTFAYTSWTDPNGPGGMVDVQTGLPLVYCGPNCSYPVLPPAAVTATNASGLDFAGDTFQHLGASGIVLGAGVTSSTVESSTFEDIGGNGVMVGSLTRPTSGGPVETGDRVVGNTFTNSADAGDPGFAVGAQYHSSAAVWSGYTNGLQIVANNLCNVSHPAPCRMPSDGIAVGWGFNTPSPAGSVGNNVIARNAIVNSMQWLWDGGPIYSLGVQPGELIRANFIAGAPQTPGAIYIDQGATAVTILDNVIEQVRNLNNPFASPPPQNEPAAAVYVHTCASGTVAIIDTFSDTTPSPAVNNSAGGCSQVAAVTLRGVFGGLPSTAMPASILAGAGVPVTHALLQPPPTAPGHVTAVSTGPVSQRLMWSGGSGTGFEVQQSDATYGTIVVGASVTSPLNAADPTQQPAYTDRVYSRDSGGSLSGPSAPVTVRSG